jgi:hypothetical protein
LVPALTGDHRFPTDPPARLTRPRYTTLTDSSRSPASAASSPAALSTPSPRSGSTKPVKRLIFATGEVIVPGRLFRVDFLPPEEVLEMSYDQIADFTAGKTQ